MSAAVIAGVFHRRGGADAVHAGQRWFCVDCFAAPHCIDLSLNAVILLQLVAFAVVYGLLRLVFVTLDLP